MSLDVDRPMVTGSDAYAPANRAVTLKSLKIANASGLVLQDAFVTLLADGPRIGTADYTPDDPRWANGKPVPGYVIAPEVGVSILAVLKRAGPGRGDASAMTLSYQVNGRPFVKSNDVSYTLAEDCELENWGYSGSPLSSSASMCPPHPSRAGIGKDHCTHHRSIGSVAERQADSG